MLHVICKALWYTIASGIKCHYQIGPLCHTFLLRCIKIVTKTFFSFAVERSYPYSMMTAIELATLLFITYISLPCCRCTCNSISTVSKAFGQYCIDHDITLSWSVSSHECNWLCIQKPTCTATNYNTSESLCFLLSNPCPQTSNEALMVYTLFTDVPRDLCLEWVEYTPGMCTDKRWALTKAGGDDLKRTVARMTYMGDIYPAYMSPPHKKCFGTNGLVEFSSGQGFICQLLRVKNGCTIRSMTYTAGDMLPPSALGIRSLSGGRVRYVVIVKPTASPGRFIGGYYIDGTSEAFIGYGGVKQESQMQLLLII